MHYLVQLAAAVACLAPVSQAFLLPPTISPDVVRLDTAGDADGVVALVACPGCPLPTSVFDMLVPAPDVEIQTSLRFTVSVTHGKEGDAVLLNGHQAYPVIPTSDIFRGALSADQLGKTPVGSWDFVASRELGYALHIHHPQETSGDPAHPLNIVEMRLEIIDVGGKDIHGIPSLEVKLLETPSGGLMLADAALGPPRAMKQCTTMFCAWKEQLKDRLSKLKHCAGMRPHHGVKNPSHHANALSQPHHPHHGFHPHHHHKHSGFSRFVRAAVLRVFIPVMIGLVIGATASVVGIAVGQLAICVYRALFRRGARPAYTPVESDANAEAETKSFLAHQDAPPVYEDAPAYEEAAAPKTTSE